MIISHKWSTCHTHILMIGHMYVTIFNATGNDLYIVANDWTFTIFDYLCFN